MSTFEVAIPIILKNERGFSDNPRDPGGVTNFGITLRFYQQHINPNAIPETIKNLNKDEAIGIYKTFYWDKYKYSQILIQIIATKIFDMAVNLGEETAHQRAQRATWAFNGYQSIDDDGILGPQTIAAINQIDQQLIHSLRSEHAARYRELLSINPFLFEFKKDWLTRAYS